MSVGLIGLTVTFGLYTILHPQPSPGGSFQGGAIAGTATLLDYLASDYCTYRSVMHKEPEEGAGPRGYVWMPWVFDLAALTGGAVLRAAGWVFAGWGSQDCEEERSPTDQEKTETKPGSQRTSVSMRATAGGLIVAAAVLGLLPGPGRWAQGAAERFLDFRAYHAAVLDALPTGAMTLAATSVCPDARSLAFACGSVLAAVAVAAWALFHDHLPPSSRPGKDGMAERFLAGLENLHRGHVGDYAAWLTADAALLGAVLVVAERH